ncbi:MAG: hypothetical protein US50_C0061G0004 [Candidatus Nomurabacteria bacterium GW2011_GWB1_37_5]|uniref:Uncharacterized protein n=1 Tax=Candidatus Nomurabacteria bacterium GW2011_GWB1_37_5 TaxID=1618742 RepID=A0A0G0H6K3_9BACT|nr:MAG: hypothetical protein US50_C0061G0004 [Candidatus Nomurabacteria bacterium GW2011_GWB1_37_5]
MKTKPLSATEILIVDFEEIRKRVMKLKLPKVKLGRNSVLFPTNSIGIRLKSGHGYIAGQFYSILVLKYPTQEEPVVSVIIILNSYGGHKGFDGVVNHFELPNEIIRIPIENMESVTFGNIGWAVCDYKSNQKHWLLKRF